MYDELIKRLRTECTLPYASLTSLKLMNEAVDAIEELSADVRPVVRGEWRLYSPLTDTFECDKCGYQVIDESFRTKFCPNCGATMLPEPPKEE